MITSSGSSTLQMLASALPTARPASSISLQGTGVPLAYELDQLVDGHLWPVHLPQRSGQRRAAGDRGQTAAVAAAAHLPVGVHTMWPSSPAAPELPEVDPAVDDHSAADPLGQHHVEHVPLAAPGTERRLGQRAEVRVVADVHGNAESLCEHLGYVDLRPRREDHPGGEAGRVGPHRRRHRDSGADATRTARSPASASSASHHSLGCRQRLRRLVRDLEAVAAGVDQQLAARFATATRTISRPKSIPTKPPDDGSRLRLVGKLRT